MPPGILGMLHGGKTKRLYHFMVFCNGTSPPDVSLTVRFVTLMFTPMQSLDSFYDDSINDGHICICDTVNERSSCKVREHISSPN